jgi:hypothetical protein
MLLKEKVRAAYLKRQGQTRQSQPQPQQPQQDFSDVYLRQRLVAQQPKPRRRIIQHEKKAIDLLRDVPDFLKD